MKFLLSFLLFFGFFLFMSGLFDFYHLSLGVISAFIGSLISKDLLFSTEVKRKKAKECLRFACYVPWLLYKVFLANLYIIRLAFHPKMKKLIDPHIVRLKTSLKKDLSVTALANSITLTPGTITVLLHQGYLYVHAIDEKVVEDIPFMEKKIKRIFEDG